MNHLAESSDMEPFRAWLIELRLRRFLAGFMGLTQTPPLLADRSKCA